jgi:hypothetical protein
MAKQHLDGCSKLPTLTFTKNIIDCPKIDDDLLVLEELGDGK